MTSPSPTEFEARARTTFLALMWSLSHPGRIHVLPDKGLRAFADVAMALVDLETSYYTPHAELAALIAPTGARARPPATAMYQFYPRLAEPDLAALAAAPAGTLAYPDESATLVIGCDMNSGQALRLRGPGINEGISVIVDGVPAAFWELRATVGRYPLGWDVFFVAGDLMIGLPRTTQVEVL